MKKIFVVLILVMALSVIVTGTALADNGPHGGFTATTAACASCHRTHTATGPKLLIGTGVNLCLSCHGTAGTGADTNVLDGVYTVRDLITEVPAEGVAGRGLLAGGFANAVMDTDLSGGAVTAVSSSSHTYDGTPGTVWAYGAISGTANTGQANTALTCMNCHDPHGKAGTGSTATYRILRNTPTGLLTAGFPAGAVNVPDETAKTYSVSLLSGNYFTQSYAPLQKSGLTNWCSQCHTRDLTGPGSANVSSGDAVFMYRHTTNAGIGGMACTSCHVAHGSSAMATGAAASAADLTAGGSALLRVDNRGVCQACHTK